MAVDIRLDPTAFESGNRFYGLNPASVVIPVGTGQPFSEFLGTPPMRNYQDRAIGTFQMMISTNSTTIATNLWDVMTEGGFNFGNIMTTLANLVDQGLIVVTKDGSVLTSSDILS